MKSAPAARRPPGLPQDGFFVDDVGHVGLLGTEFAGVQPIGVGQVSHRRALHLQQIEHLALVGGTSHSCMSDPDAIERLDRADHAPKTGVGRVVGGQRTRVVPRVGNGIGQLMGHAEPGKGGDPSVVGGHGRLDMAHGQVSRPQGRRHVCEHRCEVPADGGAGRPRHRLVDDQITGGGDGERAALLNNHRGGRRRRRGGGARLRGGGGRRRERIHW